MGVVDVLMALAAASGLGLPIILWAISAELAERDFRKRELERYERGI